MTPAQRALARHALGLPNDRSKRSYRNRYYAAFGTNNDTAWREMVRQGWALSEPLNLDRIYYELTLAGAKAAIDPGETLDLEDFPHEGTAP